MTQSLPIRRRMTLFVFSQCSSVKYTQSHMLSSLFIQLCYTNRRLLAYLRISDDLHSNSRPKPSLTLHVRMDCQ